MALGTLALEVLAKARPRSLLSLGYPDILAPAEWLKDMFGVTGLPMRTDTASVNEWHGTDLDGIVETRALFNAIGVEKLLVVDLIAHAGDELIADLNQPQDFGQFDFVLDPGTIEHCFNIGQAFRNAAGAVKEGGTICHVNPLVKINYGFFNICPTAFYDFYSKNGFIVTHLLAVRGNPVKPQVADIMTAHNKTIKGDFQNTTILTVARRAVERELQWPMQEKYTNAKAVA